METPTLNKWQKITAIKSISNDLLGRFKMLKSVETKAIGRERLVVEEMKDRLNRFGQLLQELESFYEKLPEQGNG